MASLGTLSPVPKSQTINVAMGVPGARLWIYSWPGTAPSSAFIETSIPRFYTGSNSWPATLEETLEVVEYLSEVAAHWVDWAMPSFKEMRVKRIDQCTNISGVENPPATLRALALDPLNRGRLTLHRDSNRRHAWTIKVGPKHRTATLYDKQHEVTARSRGSKDPTEKERAKAELPELQGVVRYESRIRDLRLKAIGVHSIADLDDRIVAEHENMFLGARFNAPICLGDAHIRALRRQGLGASRTVSAIGYRAMLGADFDPCLSRNADAQYRKIWAAVDDYYSEEDGYRLDLGSCRQVPLKTVGRSADEGVVS